MAKLNQIIAIEKGIKSKAYSDMSELYKLAQKPELFNGMSKVYEKKDESSEDLPAEKNRVQHTVTDTLKAVERGLTELIDITARKDFTNCEAKADVVVNGKVLITKAPVSFLLFLEKQLTDLRTFASKLPVLDEAYSWTLDQDAQLYKSEVVKTHRTKKVQKAIVLYPHSAEHPAQTQLITEDNLVGYWNQIKMSGAISTLDKGQLVDRIDTLLNAVKEARELANVQDEVTVQAVAGNIFDFILKRS